MYKSSNVNEKKSKWIEAKCYRLGGGRPQLNGELHSEKKYKYSCLLGTWHRTWMHLEQTPNKVGCLLNAFKALTSLRATLASKWDPLCPGSNCLRSPSPSRKNFAPHILNYSSPSVKNSASLAVAHIPHKLADRLLFGIWCSAPPPFSLSLFPSFSFPSAR